MNNSENSFFSRLSTPKKYAVALGLCAVVLSVLAIAVSRVGAKSEIETTTAGTTAADVRAELTNVPDTREKQTMIIPATEITTGTTHMDEITTEPVIEAPDTFTLPLGTDTGTDYSNGVPVYNDIMSDWRTHDGVDFNGAYGDGVKSIADGIVRDVYDDPLWGVIEVIDHGGGIVASYCGLQTDSTLKKGEIVSEGEKIGSIGEIPVEADAEFPHLHLELRVNDKLEDPLEIMGYYE